MIKLLLYRTLCRRKDMPTHITTSHIYLEGVQPQEVIDKWNRLGKLTTKIASDIEWWYQMIAVHKITDELPDPKFIKSSIHDV